MRGLVVVLGLSLIASAGMAADEPTVDHRLTPLTPLSPAYEGLTSDQIFAKLLDSNGARDARLRQYSAVRTYKVSNDKGKIYAQEVVRVDYRAPGRKSFRIVSEEGSGLVRDLVLKRLIESESETSSGRAHHDSAIKPANYKFTFLGEQNVGPYHCLVAKATPKRKDKYLFEGRVWIDAQDYAIVRIAGRPAKSPSFWITRADFVRDYEKLGDFWLPAQDETLVHVRLYGKKVLSIDYAEYSVNQGAGGTRPGLSSEDRPAQTLLQPARAVATNGSYYSLYLNELDGESLGYYAPRDGVNDPGLREAIAQIGERAPQGARAGGETAPVSDQAKRMERRPGAFVAVQDRLSSFENASLIRRVESSLGAGSEGRHQGSSGGSCLRRRTVC